MKRKLTKEEAEREFHYQIGRVIREWVSVESSLWLFLQSILGVDQFRARVVIAAAQSLRARLDLIKKLGETYIDPSLLQQFRKLIKRVNDLSLQRNIYAHAKIFHDAKPGTYHIGRDTFPFELDGTLSFDFLPINTNHIKVIADATQKLSFDLVRFCFYLDGKVHASARTHREGHAPRSRKRRRKTHVAGKP